ncbi:MAG: dihydroorotate dehydrogenase [Planctomycetes bacterium]|nr:dihydroorotate dehydrogenase [Planctomycetota bacterium]
MADLRTALGSLELRNPVMTASGTFGFGIEFMEYGDISALGAVVTKSITLEPRAGNEPPRIYETPSGMLNSIGLENPGLEFFKEKILPQVVSAGATMVVNIAGESPDEYGEIAGELSADDGIAALEVNAGCPNVDRGGMTFGRDPGMLADLVAAVCASTELPIIAKLTPNVADIVPLVEAAGRAGASAVTVMNTLLGMSVDVRKRVPHIKRGKAGLSGPAIRPVAVRMAFEAAQTGVPVVGAGGISDLDSAMQFFLVGARAVEVGTWNFADPAFIFRLPGLISDFLEQQGETNLGAYIGSLKSG